MSKTYSATIFEQKRSYKDLFDPGKNEPPGLPGPKITQA